MYHFEAYVFMILVCRRTN